MRPGRFVVCPSEDLASRGLAAEGGKGLVRNRSDEVNEGMSCARPRDLIVRHTGGQAYRMSGLSEAWPVRGLAPKVPDLLGARPSSITHLLP